ncbi:MAG: PEGA domain-containing protein [Acidobacteriota bacterium]
MSSLAAFDHPEAPLFSDGLGDRAVAADGATGELLQILRLHPTLFAVPSFEFALRERVARLANFRQACYVRVRRVDRAIAPASSLAIVSDHLEGTRLSDILSVAQSRGLQLDINAALCLIRQLVPGVAVLHENARDVAHGLIAPERLVVTPNGRLIIVEHVLGAAIEQLQYTRERLWQEFRVAMPPSAGLPRFDHRADVTGMGLVALALILGRPLAVDEYPQQIPALLSEAHARSAMGGQEPLSPALRSWLARALQVDVRRPFASAPEALAALEEFIGEDSTYVAAPVALDTFLSRYSESLLEADVVQPAAWTPEPARLRSQPWPEPSVHAAPPPARSDEPTPFSEIEPDDDADTDVDDFAHSSRGPELLDITDLLGPSELLPDVHDLSELIGSEPLTPMDFEPAPLPLPAATLVAPARAPAAPIASAPIAAAPVAAAPPAAPVSLFNPDAPFTAPEVITPKRAPRGPSKGRMAVMAAIVVVVAAGGFVAMKASRGTAAPAVTGALVVQSNPVGVAVFVDGVDRGRTPARLELPPGSHILELRGSGVPRVIPLNITAGAEVSQYLEFAEAPATGQLAVQSEPAGAKVLVDGADRGVAPLTITDLAPGDHLVELQANGASARHTVSVQAGGTASLVLPVGVAPTAGPVSGWVTVKAPFSLEIREDGRLLGSTDSDRIMMAAGRHELELVSEPLAYHVSRVVQVLPGKVAAVTLDLPKGVISLNATPWAEVWIDGERVGETPMGNVSVTIGPHEVVFKHPQLGEKRHAVSVTLAGPTRLSVDMK